MSVFKVTKNTVARADCSFEAAQTATISAGDIYDFDEESGGWYHCIKGWIYMIGESKDTTHNPVSILTPEVTTKASLEQGSLVSFSGNDVIYDIDGKLVDNTVDYIVDTYDNTSGIVTVYDENGNTYRFKDSLVDTITESGTVVIPADIASTSTANETVPYEEPVVNNPNKTILDTIQEKVFGKASSSKIDKDLELRVSNTRGIFGAPYQYMAIADPRSDNYDDSFGEMYKDRIAARIPLLVMIPGTPEFLAGFSDDEKKRAAEMLLGESLSDDLNNLIKTPGKYYGIKQDWPAYFKYVNNMCNIAARILGLQDVNYFGRNLGSYFWEDNARKTSSNTSYENKGLFRDDIRFKLNYRGGVAFYVNAENTINESFGNATTQSALMSKINGLSDLGREINFITGATNTTLGHEADLVTSNGENATNTATKAQTVEKIVGSGIGVHNLIGALSSGLTTIISGGRLMFPEIWSDSQFSRDYNVSIKLVSPDCDKLSIFLNIIVPYLHLVGFVAPHNVNVNGYISPFLVRAYYKGMFNCDMGMITSMSVTKGGEGNWTPSGIPTVIDVQLSIKELYGTMSINNNEQANASGILSNLILMDYIGNLCGVNIQEMDVLRAASFYYAVYKNKLSSFFYEDLAGGLELWCQNSQLAALQRLFGRR